MEEELKGGRQREREKGGDGARALQSRIDTVRLNKKTAPLVITGLLLRFLEHPDRSSSLVQSVSSFTGVL